tara:strand:- start:61 stop:297 length:237 start_codon:yes stop_codon:yes gene_type:complete
LRKKQLIKFRNVKITEYDKNVFVKNLYKIGYKKSLNKKNNKLIKFITTAFQRRFRQEQINGVIDKECLIISNNLVKKF